ncbi:guanylate kinase [Lacisediminihabitans changchengi]|uniref:Guanylate kinase n=1 Tax=Lacisediminihabitans changchengi TaxID=2787634 RepID=A0A934SHM0_9MICO|nr:guanylate kinase [Lacisediminihabitans changchengi]MBK4346791.1 guanylate kinase [Lacisediminihabitans changchengi]MBK4348086.1 guanylate kinase [Lacisediminihabitans changchengi]
MPRVAPPDVDRVAAAQAAVAARRARAAVKQDIHDRKRSALEVAEAAWTGEHTAPEATLRVRELLTSMPGLGPTRVARVMEQLEIAESKRVGGLGIRQRRRLLEWLVAREHRGSTPEPARLVVLAGPTAVGKGTVSTYIRDNYPDVHLSVSATTRTARPGEVDGVHYFFVSDDEFDQLIESGQMLETATVHNSFRYGTPRPPIDAALAEGKSVLLEIDLQGARSVRRAMPEAVLVFLLPPTWEELVRRLIGRGTEDSVEQARRLETAKIELAAQDEFDYKVINSEVSRAAQEVVDLLS